MAKLNTALTEFGKWTRELAELLKRNPTLNIVDQVLIENHLQVVQLAYIAWKRRHASEDQGSHRDGGRIGSAGLESQSP